MKRFIDQILENKKNIPGSNHYDNTQHKKDFYDVNKKSRIYTSDRKSAIQIMMAEKKFVPGVGKYNIILTEA